MSLSILFLVNILGPIPKEWQRNGKIEFQDVTIQYQPESSPVLQNINMMVKPGQKVQTLNDSTIFLVTFILYLTERYFIDVLLIFR